MQWRRGRARRRACRSQQAAPPARLQYIAPVVACITVAQRGCWVRYSTVSSVFRTVSISRLEISWHCPPRPGWPSTVARAGLLSNLITTCRQNAQSNVTSRLCAVQRTAHHAADGSALLVNFCAGRPSRAFRRISTIWNDSHSATTATKAKPGSAKGCRRPPLPCHTSLLHRQNAAQQARAALQASGKISRRSWRVGFMPVLSLDQPELERKRITAFFQIFWRLRLRPRKPLVGHHRRIAGCTAEG